MKKKPKILLLVDYPEWAFDICASAYTKYLEDEFVFVKKYKSQKPLLIPFSYDLIHVFWWGEQYYKKFYWPKKKILKEISSHRWEDDPRYGPCTPEQMKNKYLSDASWLFTTSQRLFDVFKPICDNLSLVNNGYSDELFNFKTDRSGDSLSICWAGNIEDEVKGIKDIIIPATINRYSFKIASKLKQTELPNFYNSHDVYVVASRHEASPLPLMEAMACGCFPVCTDVGIVPELIKHKINGYVVNNRSVDAFLEAFSWCSDNLDFIRKAGKDNSILIREKRRWEVCAESFRIAYKQALRAGK
jgi:glycosyltransferase involved in cell wall biosynthesis